MSTRREEIELELELLELEEKFLAAKADGADSSHPDRVAFSEARVYWRQIREAVAAGIVPEPDTKKKG